MSAEKISLSGPLGAALLAAMLGGSSSSSSSRSPINKDKKAEDSEDNEPSSRAITPSVRTMNGEENKKWKFGTTEASLCPQEHAFMRQLVVAGNDPKIDIKGYFFSMRDILGKVRDCDFQLFDLNNGEWAGDMMDRLLFVASMSGMPHWETEWYHDLPAFPRVARPIRVNAVSGLKYYWLARQEMAHRVAYFPDSNKVVFNNPADREIVGAYAKMQNMSAEYDNMTSF